MTHGGKLATFSLKVINYISDQKITLKNEILFYNKLDKENIENFITNVVDGIQLDGEQEHHLVKFINVWYENLD